MFRKKVFNNKAIVKNRQRESIRLFTIITSSFVGPDPVLFGLVYSTYRTISYLFDKKIITLANFTLTLKEFSSFFETLENISYNSGSFATHHPNPDPHVSGPPGSGSISQRYGSGSGSLYHQAKILRKTLIPTAV
jgi:hypothetical protein